MRAIFLASSFSIILSGCVGFSTEKVPRDTRFRSIGTPADIAAVYSNIGTSPSGGTRNLTYPIFGTDTFSATPDHIRFRSSSPLNLVCDALSGGRVVASRELAQDTDFRIAGGAMHLVSAKAKGFAGEGVLGVEKHSTVIRLTDAGDVVLTQRASEAGMALFVVPMARTDTMETLFRRIGSGAAQ